MTRQRIAQTNQQHRREVPQASRTLQRAAIRFVPETVVQPKEDTEQLASSKSPLHQDFSRVPISMNLMRSLIGQPPVSSGGQASIQRQISIAGTELQENNSLLTALPIRQRMNSYGYEGYYGAGRFSDDEINLAVNNLAQDNAMFISNRDYLNALDNRVGRIVFRNINPPGINRIRTLMTQSNYAGYQGPGALSRDEIAQASNTLGNQNVRFNNKAHFDLLVENAVFSNRKNIYRGQHGFMEFNSIPHTYQIGLRNIINGINVNAYSRGPHITNPLSNGGSTTKTEYHLDAQQNGRATSCVVNGVKCFYYSTTHAAATYNYHLILRDGKPIMRGGINVRFQVVV